MYVQLKKVVIIIIFLISIIGLLGFQNYQLKGTFYNVLLVSNEDDTTTESLTKVVWDQITNLNVDEDITKYYTNINYKYLEVKNPQDLKRNLENQNGVNDMTIIIGDAYNDYLKNFIDTHPTDKIILVENSSKLSGENIYRVNIDWNEIFASTHDYLKKEIANNEDLLDGEKLKVVYLLNDINDSKYKSFTKYVDDLDVELIPMDMNDSNFIKDISTKYEEGIQYFINFEFNSQTDITNKLVSLQKENISQVYDYQEQKQDKKDTKIEEVKYKPINYMTIYTPNISLGEYDYALDDKGYTKNIIVNEIGLNYYDVLKEIIINEDSKKKVVLNKKDNTLIINENIKGE